MVKLLSLAEHQMQQTWPHMMNTRLSQQSQYQDLQACSRCAKTDCLRLWLVQEAQRHIAVAKKDIKLTSKELNQQLADMEELLNTNLRRAERENSTVYLQRVPNIADLPAIQPFPVAK